MRRWEVVVVSSILVAACSRKNAPSAGDSTAVLRHIDDSVIALRTQQAPALGDTARSTLAVLLQHPETAVFDSVVVVQPPKESGSWPTPWVCGRIGGKPGIGGRNTMTPFIYQSRINVFVLDQRNGANFAALRAKVCDNPAARVLLR